jgi:uncharacterized membrane protein YfcA
MIVSAINTMAGLAGVGGGGVLPVMIFVVAELSECRVSSLLQELIIDDMPKI